jgi:hypothetical protein
MPKENDPEQVLSGSISTALSSVSSFHDLRLGVPCLFLAVLFANMIQHGVGGLRAATTEAVIELVNTLNVQTLFALENWPADLASADRVHHTEHTTVSFRPL